MGVEESALFTLAASSFEGNAAHNGGAVYAWNIDGAARVHVTTSMFRGNKAAVTAGGLFADNLKNLSLSSSTFHGNTANLEGGGVVVKRPRNLRVAKSTFKENVLRGNAGSEQVALVRGAGMYLADAKDNNMVVVIANNSFANNTAQYAHAFTCHGGGMYLTNIDVASLGRVVFLRKQHLSRQRRRGRGGVLLSAMSQEIWYLPISIDPQPPLQKVEASSWGQGLWYSATAAQGAD